MFVPLSSLTGIAALILPVSAGYAIVISLFAGRRFSLPATLALSYGMGMGLLAQLMLILGILKIPYGPLSIGIPLFLTAAILLLFQRKRRLSPDVAVSADHKIRLPEAVSSFVKAPLAHKALYLSSALYLSYVLFLVLWRALDLPVHSYDAIAVIAIKAKVLFYERILTPIRNTHHPFYPLQVPFSEAWVAIVTGKWDDQAIKVIFPAVFISFVVLYVDLLRRHATFLWTVLGILFLTSSNFLLYHASISYRDMFLLYYNCSIVILLMHWHTCDDDAFLLIAGLFAGFATFTKLEGTILIFVYTALIVLLFMKKRSGSFKAMFGRYLKFAAPAFGMCTFYSIYRMAARIPPTPDKGNVEIGLASFGRIPLIVKAFWEDIFFTGCWNIIWFLLAVSILANLKRIKTRPEARFILAALLLFFGAYFLIGMFTGSFRYIGGSGTSTTLSRLILHFFPLATMLIALLNTPDRPKAPERAP